jgi:hypothetical protein
VGCYKLQPAWNPARVAEGKSLLIQVLGVASLL